MSAPDERLARDRQQSTKPDRTPPPGRWLYKIRVDQRCEVCGQTYAIVPNMAQHYHTCSPSCTLALRSRQRRERRQEQS